MKIAATIFIPLLVSLVATTNAWTLPSSSSSSSSVAPIGSQQTTSVPLLSRADVLKQTMGATTLAFGMLWTTTSKSASAETTADGITYQVIKTGDGPKPEIGELIAIRFAAYVAATGNKIDDIFDSPEPYYTRLGSGGLLKGVESTLPLMRLGDRWKLTIPGSLAFGSKGRPASAGKPRIPADAEIIFEVEMVGLPGKEPELIDLIGDD